MAACTALIASGPQSSDYLVPAFADRGIAYENENDHSRAIADFNEAMRLWPKNKYQDQLATLFGRRGAVYAVQDDYGRAITDLNEAIRLDPRYADGLYLRGLVENKLGRKAEGAADIARAKVIDPNVDK